MAPVLGSYLADDLKHERKVALKVLKPELAAIVGAERFLAEIKTTANLQHPHILPLHDSGEADGFLFYVMPYVEGGVAQAEARPRAPASGRRGGADRDERRRGARLRAPPRRDPPGHQAGEHPAQDGKPVVSDFGIALALGTAGAGSPDGDGSLLRHAALHEPGAGDGGPARGSCDGRVCAGVRAVRDAGG